MYLQALTKFSAQKLKKDKTMERWAYCLHELDALFAFVVKVSLTMVTKLPE